MIFSGKAPTRKMLIAEALLNAPNGMLTLAGIYEAINAKYPFFKMGDDKWKNSIRHNLSLKDHSHIFIKEKGTKRGNFWKLLPGAKKEIFGEKAQKVKKTKTSLKQITPNENVEMIVPSQQSVQIINGIDGHAYHLITPPASPKSPGKYQLYVLFIASTKD